MNTNHIGRSTRLGDNMNRNTRGIDDQGTYNLGVLFVYLYTP